VVKKLLEQPNTFTPIATVRSKSSAGKLTSEGLPESALVEFDLAAAAAAAGAAPAALTAALQGADALVIATSGVPQVGLTNFSDSMECGCLRFCSGPLTESVRRGCCGVDGSV
jgi:hypothetical protein